MAASRTSVEKALRLLESIDDWDPELVVSAHERPGDPTQEWMLEAWYPRRPGTAQKTALLHLLGERDAELRVEKLPDQDWVALSQQGFEPIPAGPFYVRTADFPPEPSSIDLIIPAAQAFGTGHHHTTSGCLEMLAAMKRRGLHPRDIADIGTGTGLLGMAAMALWPAAFVTASDIDPICAEVVVENARLNDVAIGAQRGAMAMVIAPGMAHPLLEMRGPYDLLIANILAGPLIDLAPEFAVSVAPGGSVLLAGLLIGKQERAVRRAYRRAGFHTVARLARGDWAILWLRRRRQRGLRGR